MISIRFFRKRATFGLVLLLGLVALAVTRVVAALPESSSSTDPSEAIQLLVTGGESNNIVRFNLDTGESTVIARLANGSHPRSIVVNQVGEVFVALSGNKKNIVKLVPSRPNNADSPLVPVDVTRTIGRYGPGLMAFDQRGLLNIAGDTERGVLQFDFRTNEIVKSMRLRQRNLVGLAVAGDHVYHGHRIKMSAKQELFEEIGAPCGSFSLSLQTSSRSVSLEKAENEFS